MARRKGFHIGRTKLLEIAAATFALCTAAGLLAANFQVYEVSPGNYAESVWPGDAPTVTWNENFTTTPENVVDNGSGIALSTVLANSFSTWATAAYKGAAVTNISFNFGGASTTLPQGPTLDCQNVVGFADPNAASDFPSGIIAFSAITTVPNGFVPGRNCPSYTTPCPVGSCIVDVDIMFNPDARFATAAAGPNQYDLQSVATHEIGHLLGLDHSNIAHAVMYPYGDTSLIGIHTALWTDDLIGAGHLYPGPASPGENGITGVVTLDNNPLYAADVIAIDAANGNVVAETLTDPAGNYHLHVFDGRYYVYVQGLAPNLNAGPTTITNFRGQAGYGSNRFNNIPPNPSNANYTGAFY